MNATPRYAQPATVVGVDGTTEELMVSRALPHVPRALARARRFGKNTRNNGVKRRWMKAARLA